MTPAEMLEQIEERIRVHLQWARHQEARRRAGRKPAANVGGATFHRYVVREYREMVACLQELHEKAHGRPIP